MSVKLEIAIYVCLIQMLGKHTHHTYVTVCDVDGRRRLRGCEV